MSNKLTNNSIKILHLEDSLVDAELIRELILDSEVDVSIELVQNSEQYLTALRSGHEYDVVITDFLLPHYDAFEAIAAVEVLAPRIPVICVSGAIGEEKAIEVLKAGAVDYILKDRLARLPSAIQRAYDLSRERKMRLEAEEENRILSRALNQSPVPIVITRNDRIILFVNNKVSGFFGYEPGELIGSEVTLFGSGEIARDTFLSMWEVVESGGEYRGEFRGVKKNGGEFVASMIASPVLNDSREATYYVISMEDITLRKELETRLLLEKERAETASRLKDAFISNLSHEIRTPLNGILGMANIIEEAYRPFSLNDQEGYFDTMDRSVKRLIKTVEMLLSISRLQLGDYPYHPEEFSLPYLLESVISGFEEAAAAKGLELKLEAAPGDQMVYADNDAIRDVLGHLLDNAIKYTREGRINVTTGTDDKGLVFARIEDTGVGISDNFKAYLFTPFRQQETGLSRPFEGLGLGLPISKRLLEINECTIDIDSHSGKGTVITIKFHPVKPV